MGEAMHIGELILQELQTLNKRLAFVEKNQKEELNQNEASSFLKINSRYLPALRDFYMEKAYKLGKQWYYNKKELEEIKQLIIDGEIDYKVEHVKHQMSKR